MTERVRLGIIYPNGAAEQEYYQFAELWEGLRLAGARANQAGFGRMLAA